jgi:LmbE family N-acetylglucosaminyl deacetylase
MKNIVVIGAHLDDAEFGMGGTLAKLSNDYNITLCVFCKGNRPGSEYVQSSREDAIRNNITDLNISEYIQLDYSDISLDTIPFIEISSCITKLVDKISPYTVFTHYSQDIHTDHKIISNATRVACRPRESCSVHELYEYSIPGSTEWSFTDTKFNTFFDISNYTHIKYECISRYKTEVKTEIDPLNLEYVKHRDLYYGGLFGYRAAEPFINIFSKR